MSFVNIILGSLTLIVILYKEKIIILIQMISNYMEK